MGQERTAIELQTAWSSVCSLGQNACATDCSDDRPSNTSGCQIPDLAAGLSWIEEPHGDLMSPTCHTPGPLIWPECMDEAVMELNKKSAPIAGIANLNGVFAQSAAMQHAATVENMRAAALFLASDHALNIIEAVIPADAGGYILN